MVLQRAYETTVLTQSGEMHTAAFAAEDGAVVVSALKLPRTRWQCHVYMVDEHAKEIGRFEVVDLDIDELSVEAATLLEMKIPGWVSHSSHLRAVK